MGSVIVLVRALVIGPLLVIVLPSVIVLLSLIGLLSPAADGAKSAKTAATA